MVEYPFNQSSIGRAIGDTRRPFHSFLFWLFEVAFSAALTIMVLLWQPSWADLGWKMTVYQVLVPSLGGVIASLVLLFLVNLFVAPYRQRNEARVQLRQSVSDDIGEVIATLRNTTVDIDGSPVDIATILRKFAEKFALGIDSHALAGLVKHHFGDGGDKWEEWEERNLKIASTLLITGVVHSIQMNPGVTHAQSVHQLQYDRFYLTTLGTRVSARLLQM